MKPGDYGYTRVVSDREIPVQKRPPKPPPKSTKKTTEELVAMLCGIAVEKLRKLGGVNDEQ